MSNFDDYTRAVQTLNDETKTRLASGATWRTNHPGQEYTPIPLSAQAAAAENKIRTICQKVMDTDGSPYTEAQLVEFCFAYRTLGYPSTSIEFLGEFLKWQRRQQTPEMEMATNLRNKPQGLNSPVGGHSTS